MAHELDTRENGVKAMFSVRETPWHNEGTILADAPSLDEALTLGGLNFDVECRPMEVVCEAGENDSVNVPVEGFRGVVRTDRNKVLGVVGKNYHALQNRDAFAVLEPLLDAGIATLETGGTLRDGRDVWMMVRFNIDEPKVREVFSDEVVPFGLISNNHSGYRQVTLQETPVRVVCANTLGMALGQRGKKCLKVMHTKSVGTKTVEAAQSLFASITARYVTIAEQYELLKQTTMSRQGFQSAVLDLLAEIPSTPASFADNRAQLAFERTKARQEEKRQRLTFLRDNGAGHSGDGSAWEAYNAVTQSFDHDVDLWKVQGETRVASMYEGKIARQKQDALEAIYAYAQRASK